MEDNTVTHAHTTRNASCAREVSFGDVSHCWSSEFHPEGLNIIRFQQYRWCDDSTHRHETKFTYSAILKALL